MRLADGREVSSRQPARWIQEESDYPPHNHVTRAQRRPGLCPACDAYYWRVLCREHDGAVIRSMTGAKV